jgi:hypothetical protein
MKALYGVSEVLGALLVFLVIVSTAGVLYMMSYPIILEGQRNLDYRNALAGLAEIRELMGRIKSGTEPIASITLSLGSSSLHVEDKKFEVYVDGDGFEAGRLEINSGDKKLIFEGGGIFENGTNYEITLIYPEIHIVQNGSMYDLYFPVYNITGNFSAGGGRVTVNLKLIDVKSYTGSSIAIYSDLYEEWKESFEKAKEVADAGSVGVITYADHINVTGLQTVKVVRYDIEVS